MSYEHPLLDEPVFEKVFPGPKPSAYFRASKDPHRIMLSIAEDFQWIVTTLAREGEIEKDDIRGEDLPNVALVLDSRDFHRKFEDNYVIEKSVLVYLVSLLNLLPEKKGQFLWKTYFLYLRCSYEVQEEDKKHVTKTAFYTHRNEYVSDFLELLSLPYDELLEQLTPVQKKWFPFFPIATEFQSKYRDPCILSSFGEEVFHGPRETDLTKEDADAIRKTLLARKVL